MVPIEDQHAALQSHVGQLENEKSQLDQVLGTMVAGSNGELPHSLAYAVVLHMNDAIRPTL